MLKISAQKWIDDCFATDRNVSGVSITNNEIIPKLTTLTPPAATLTTTPTITTSTTHRFGS